VSTHRQFGYLERNRFVSVGWAGVDATDSIREDSAGDLWIADQQKGLFQLRDSKFVKQIPWIGLGHKDFALSLAADPLRGGIWLGFYQGGISHFADGRIQETYTAADGLANGSVGNLEVERDGTLWAATDGGLRRIKNGHFATLSRENGLPCDAIHWMIQGDDHSYWLYTPCGLLRLARSEMDAWTAAADRHQAAKQMVHPTVFDFSELSGPVIEGAILAGSGRSQWSTRESPRSNDPCELGQHGRHVNQAR
jgi:ligand-binding sensor domain-containing protein